MCVQLYGLYRPLCTALIEVVSEEVYSRGEVRNSCMYCVQPILYCLAMRWGRREGGEAEER